MLLELFLQDALILESISTMCVRVGLLPILHTAGEVCGPLWNRRRKRGSRPHTQAHRKRVTSPTRIHIPVICGTDFVAFKWASAAQPCFALGARACVWLKSRLFHRARDGGTISTFHPQTMIHLKSVGKQRDVFGLTYREITALSTVLSSPHLTRIVVAMPLPAP